MISAVLIEPAAYRDIQRHQLEEQLKKVVRKLKSGVNAGVDLKKREPKSMNVWQFRITQKYRAYAKRNSDRLIVYAIDDHQ